MALFDTRTSETDELSGSDVATRALSVTAVENDFVAGVYEKLASVYDFTFGPTLHAGRLRAIQRMGIRPGDRVLEVGVGTGDQCRTVSAGLHRHRNRPVRLPCWRRRASAWPARTSATCACSRWMPPTCASPTARSTSCTRRSLISVVPDPITVAREMGRVCRPGGRIIFLNHFRSRNPLLASIERAISPFTVHIGFKSDLDLPAFLAQADLEPISIEKVNIPRIWSLVTCVKE